MLSAHTTTKDLAFLGDLIEASKLRPVIDRRYPFSELPEAIRHLEEGHVRGRVVVGEVGWASPTRPSLRPTLT